MENGYKPNLAREVKLQWAQPPEIISTPVEVEFFLDIPFYNNLFDVIVSIRVRTRTGGYERNRLP